MRTQRLFVNRGGGHTGLHLSAAPRGEDLPPDQPDDDAPLAVTRAELQDLIDRMTQRAIERHLRGDREPPRRNAEGMSVHSLHGRDDAPLVPPALLGELVGHKPPARGPLVPPAYTTRSGTVERAERNSIGAFNRRFQAMFARRAGGAK